ncbi:MAG: hypothetical protein M3440_08195 [Chloroflexota bacterium]|nr:hypothetical protein [Chloroflexota bacterium]
MVKPIVVQVTKQTGDYVKGAELGFDSEAKATSTLGDGTFKIVRHQDFSEYEAPAARESDDIGKKGK